MGSNYQYELLERTRDYKGCKNFTKSHLKKKLLHCNDQKREKPKKNRLSIDFQTEVSTLNVLALGGYCQHDMT
jgi:hypothetical protein